MRTFTIYLCTAEHCLGRYVVEAGSSLDAEAIVRAAFPDLPAEITAYRSC